MTRSALSILGISLIVTACANGTLDGGAGLDAPDPGPVDPGDAATDAAPPRTDSGADGGDQGGFDAAPPPLDAPRGDAPVNLACGKTFDFEASDGAFTHAPMDGASGGAFDAWSYGAAADSPNCHSGTKCFATNLAGPYAQCQRGELRSPALDLSSCAGAASVEVTFWQAYDFVGYADAIGTTYYDGGVVEISGDGGATWTAATVSPAPAGKLAIAAARGVIGEYVCPGPSSFYANAKSGFVDKSSGWQPVSVDVPAALRTSQFMIRFAYASGKSTADNKMTVTAAGWHLDDVAVVAK